MIRSDYTITVTVCYYFAKKKKTFYFNKNFQGLEYVESFDLRMSHFICENNYDYTSEESLLIIFH